MHSYNQYKTAYEALLQDIDRLHDLAKEGEPYEVITHYIDTAWEQANHVRSIDDIVAAARSVA